MPIQTRPFDLGAPLSDTDYAGPWQRHTPSTTDLRMELIRAQIELVHAIARHRKAWSKMRREREGAEARSIWADSHPPYKEAVADVRWWREEMIAQATTVTALRTSIDALA